MKRSIILGSVLALVLLAALVLLWLDGFFLAPWQDKTLSADVDGDGIGEELLLTDRCLRLKRGEAVLWQTKAEWKVEDVLWGDIGMDGRQELAVLVWRRGSYGEARPFWVTEEDRSYSQHIFLYHWEGETFKPFWMSSRLQPGIKRWALNERGNLEILTDKGEETVWTWRTWGLERIDIPPSIG